MRTAVSRSASVRPGRAPSSRCTPGCPAGQALAGRVGEPVPDQEQRRHAASIPAARSAARTRSGEAGQPHLNRRALRRARSSTSTRAAVVLGDVLDDREAEAGPAGLARPRPVDAVEAFEDPRQVARSGSRGPCRRSRGRPRRRPLVSVDARPRRPAACTGSRCRRRLRTSSARSRAEPRTGAAPIGVAIESATPGLGRRRLEPLASSSRTIASSATGLVEHAAGLEPGEVEQVRDDPRQPDGLAFEL